MSLSDTTIALLRSGHGSVVGEEEEEEEEA